MVGASDRPSANFPVSSDKRDSFPYAFQFQTAHAHRKWLPADNCPVGTVLLPLQKEPHYNENRLFYTLKKDPVRCEAVAALLLFFQAATKKMHNCCWKWQPLSYLHLPCSVQFPTHAGVLCRLVHDPAFPDTTAPNCCNSLPSADHPVVANSDKLPLLPDTAARIPYAFRQHEMHWQCSSMTWHKPAFPLNDVPASILLIPCKQSA